MSFRACLLFSLLFTGCFSGLLAQPCSITHLSCEYLEDPLGIDTQKPRLHWQLNDSRLGARQTAYEILIGSDSLGLLQNKGIVWNSGKRLSSSQTTPYAGTALQPFTKYYWLVRVWDKDGKPTRWSPTASFETGMMHGKNWQGAWISDSRDINEKAAPYFRKEFKAKRKIKSARVYISAAGLFELSINGHRIGNQLLDPMYTRFDKRLLYVTHDITSYLTTGDNAIGVLLGNGWYNHQSTAVWYFHEAPWRGRPAFCADIRITYEDGSVETYFTDKSWKTSLSPVIFNSIYTAEHYDARKEQEGWNKTGFDDSKWKGIIYRQAPTANIVAQALRPIRATDTIAAVAVKKFSDTNYVFDLGRNISGVTRLTVNAKAGTVIRLRHSERIYADGKTDMSNIDVHYRPKDDSDPFQTDIYTSSGKGEESFQARFNYKGFQYIEVSSSAPIQLTKESITGYFMHSDVPPVGTIHTSNPTINKIWRATNNSYLSNLFGYPTDCPQREKNGWTGDAHIASETGLYNFDGITVYEKWMADHQDEQQPNGVLPSIIPSNGWGYEWGNGPDWTSTIAIIPWNIYLFYGDTSLLSRCYENIKRYVDHIHELYPSGLTTWGLGDWVPVKSKTPVEFTSTAYYYTDVLILSKAAQLLGKKQEHIQYRNLAEKIKTVFNDKYLNKNTGIYGSGLQTELSVPLQWGLVPETHKGKVAAQLAKRVKADNNHIDVGLLGTKAILNALSENGYADLAYMLAAQESFPSWGWWIKNGATTLYENWPIDAKSDISMNHIMFGEIGAWFYKALGGIRPDPNMPGFKNILLEPHFVEGLNEVESSHRSLFGHIVSSWKKSGDQVIYTAIIPANSTASVTLPIIKDKVLYMNGAKLTSSVNSFKQNLVAGKYVFEYR